VAVRDAEELIREVLSGVSSVHIYDVRSYSRESSAVDQHSLSLVLTC
jgi:hypothetical protein